MNERRKTFGATPDPTDDDLGAADFKPRPIARPDPSAARRVAEEGGYTAGATRAHGDTQRRYRTGRTAQLNLKVTPENRARFAAMADAAGVSLNELFERAVDALDAKMASK